MKHVKPCVLSGVLVRLYDHISRKYCLMLDPGSSPLRQRLEHGTAGELNLRMSTSSERAAGPSRTKNGVLAVWGAVSGMAPHVLHHIGPIAGSALIAGVAGRTIFAAIGLVASVPFMLRLHRRFETWVAPAIALAAFVLGFVISTFIVGPWLAGEPKQMSEHPGHDPVIQEHRRVPE